METTPLNVFILGDYALVANGLRHKLQRKFGSAVQVSVFCDLHQCLKRVDNLTQMVVLDEYVEGRPASLVASQFRAINPQLEVVLHDSAQQVVQNIAVTLRQRLVPEAAAVFAFV
jgi:DNA-binding NarL/FixJ family response regulator